ncbi:LINE-1 retrotransposable element ORF1 protein isoform X2 [Amphiprion ocellaris]|uniref:LINE-1 retrotransposable element ORF1 protein isoform X2 n=1 Tax=Amphiprion ocellaris TaxID=80972 RepID=UPI002410B70B|nr:LINE-1 retrotransposable element ORF1 protein isoform X2 [Amphiprion ocellaris]
MYKTRKTEKKTLKASENAEETEYASDEEANNGEANANLALQHGRLLESISSLTKEILDFKRDIKQDLGEFKEDVTKKIQDDLKEFKDEMLQKLEKQNANIDEAQTRIADLEAACIGMKDTLLSTIKQNMEMRNKLVDLEGRGRRNNLRIYGVPEGKEGKSVQDFVSELLKTHIKLPEGVQLQIQRAHRALISKPAATATPRSIIVNFLQFQVKEMVLRMAWQTKIELDGKRLYFDNDYTSETMEKRKAYGPIKTALKERGVRFQTPYTRMKIFWDNGLRIYDTADEAAQDLTRRGFKLTWTKRTDQRGSMEDRLAELMPWTRVGAEDRVGLRARGRLTEFRRTPV